MSRGFCGWFARDAAMLERVGRVFFEREPTPIRRVFWLDDAFALADGGPALEQAASGLVDRLGAVRVSHIGFGDGERLADWLAAFNVLRPGEIWTALGAWISHGDRRFGAKTAARFAAVQKAAGADTTQAQAFREAGRARIADLLGDDGVLVLPTVPIAAPAVGVSDDEAPALRERIFLTTCLSPMLGFPEISLPLATAGGLPMGLSLLGPRDSDAMLLAAAREATA
jgi:amidase